MKGWLALLGIVAAGLLGAPRVSAGAWTDSWETMRSTAKGVRTIQADFTQERTLRLLRKPMVSTGKLAFRHPAELRWEYASPIESVLIMHGGAVERYVRRDGHLVSASSVRTDAMAAVMNEINLWLSGDFSSSKLFVPELKHEGGAATVELVPTEPKMRELIRRVSLELGEKPGVVRSIVIDEGSEGTTRITFAHVRINDEIGDDRFTVR